jgi:shikimate kinase
MTYAWTFASSAANRALIDQLNAEYSEPSGDWIVITLAAELMRSMINKSLNVTLTVTNALADTSATWHELLVSTDDEIPTIQPVLGQRIYRHVWKPLVL